MSRNNDSVQLKCKYYGYVNFPKVFSNGTKFPFNDIEKLKELGLRIIKRQKLTRKSFRNLNISIDKEVLKIDSNRIVDPIYNFRSNEHYNPWSCIVGSKELKMIVIMALTRDINSNIIITCDVVKITANKKKMLKFFDIYKKYFIKEQYNLINMDYIYTNSISDNYLDDSYYYDTLSNETIPENDSNNGYMDVLPYDNNNDEQPLIN